MSETVPGVESAKADPSSPGGSLQFLVVDDSEDIRELMVRMVARLGHRADEAEHGQKAVEALAVKHYDVMLLDLSMPVMTGEDVVRWLRDNPEHGEGLEVVVVSAWAGDKRPALHELGVSRVLPKPFRQQQLADLVEEIRNT